ncbi:MAG TPA: hypothetical protein EYQ50_00325 [Verrucomicrobiales bacterium]|nr:hypothetical protein [Verrucomicrobiales bacterium]
MARNGYLKPYNKDNHPNILFIMTDQHFADVMSKVMGERYVKTPQLDAWVKNGLRFARAFAPNPTYLDTFSKAFQLFHPMGGFLANNGSTGDTALVAAAT